MSWRYCQECLEKQREIDRLKEENLSLKAKLRYQDEKAGQGFFGSSTPSSKVPVKPSSLPERQARTGGAKVGHPGHGRPSLPVEKADRVEEVPGPKRCPECRGPMDVKGIRERAALDLKPVKVESIVYRLERRQCRRCGKVVLGLPPGLLPKCRYGTGLLSHVAVQHYLYGTTLGQLERQTGVGYGSLVDAMHQLARRLEGIIPRLIREYRRAPVRHADETGWRTDGGNGYTWLFCAPRMSLYRLRSTRSASVVQEVLGRRRLRGVLVVDRYAGYNRVPCAIQYCFAHLLRDVRDLEQTFPDQPEVRCFVQTVLPLLAGAMSLRGQGLSRREYRRRAQEIRRKIDRAMHRPAQHLAIRTIQDLFREKADRLYHWTRDPTIPAENNFAERELRPLVVARKISFGSQSKAGAHMREVLMSILHTLRKRSTHPAEAFRDMLNRLAVLPSTDPFDLLFAPSRPR